MNGKTDNKHETYSRLELDMLIDQLIMFMWSSEDEGFVQYRIRGIYVSPEVVRQALNERLERMVVLEDD